MAFLLSSERPSSAVTSPRGFIGAVVAWLSAARAARQRRMSLESLLEFDDTRLRDIGIRRSDLFDALENDHVRAGFTLAQRRASRSRAWLER